MLIEWVDCQMTLMIIIKYQELELSHDFSGVDVAMLNGY